MNAIIDRDGNLLAQANLRVGDDGRVLLAESVQRGSRLVRYYFQDGGRHVGVRFDDGVLEGLLATRWTGGRRTWVVRLETATAVLQRFVSEPALAPG